MASIYKRKADRRDKRKPYLIAYTDEHGKRRTVSGCTDRAATEEIAGKLEADARLRKRGILDPTRERIAAQSKRPIGEHIGEFVQHVKAGRPGGHAPRYLLQVENRLDLLRESSELKYLGELDADRVAAFVGELQRKKLSGITINEYLGTIKAFTRWCVSTCRLPTDPLAALKRQDASRIDKTRPRRALSSDEIGALLHAARIRPVMEVQTIRHGPKASERTANVRAEVVQRAERLGAERVLAYLLALWTGLRRSELRALRWQDVRLDNLPAQLELRASTTKSKRADRIALHPQVAELLRTHRAGKTKPTDRVLRAVPSMTVLRADLKMAGIDGVNEAGRVDLHSMRKSLTTYLLTNGIPMRVAQAHLRHTDPRLTAGVYTDEMALPVAAKVSALPWLPTEPDEGCEAIRMTGTGDDPRAAHTQRAGRIHRQFDAKRCANTEVGAGQAEESLPSVDSQVSVDMRGDSTKRVKRFEPSTFTLAT